MTTLAAHPFIRGGTLHGARIEPTRAPAAMPKRHEVEDEYEVDLPPLHKRRSVIMASTGGLVLAALAAVGAMAYGNSSAAGGEALAKGEPEGVARVDISGPAIVGNQIPADYPGLYPGEQIVIYHLAPLATEETVEETDENGCTWLRVQGKTSGIMAYPKIGENDRQVCTDQSKEAEPLQARMIPDTLPQVDGSTLRIIDIIDARTGSSLVARAVPSLDSMIGMGGPEQEDVAIANLPSQSAPARQVAISTAADAGSRPQQPARQVAAAPQRTEFRREPTQLEPIRRADPYVPPADDEMVPISGDSSLRAIRPGDQPAATNPRRVSTPNGSPLEGYASISGN